VEKVAHRIDEHAARLAPTKRFCKFAFDQLHLAGPLRAGWRHNGESGIGSVPVVFHLIIQPKGMACFVDRPAESRRYSLRVTVAATFRDAGTAANWIPNRIGPFDTSFSHLSLTSFFRGHALTPALDMR